MIATPSLIFCWFHFVGWLLDRWRFQRARLMTADPLLLVNNRSLGDV